MYVVHVASEVAPVAKVGGLGDVVYSFAKATAALGHHVDVIIPKYDTLDYEQIHHLKPQYRRLWTYDGSDPYHNLVWEAKTADLSLLLIDPDHPHYYFNRGSIYGEVDDIDRFIYFSRAVCEYLYKSGKRPDIIHLHDWPVSLVAPLYQEMYLSLGMKVGGVVLTIHNLAHQGLCRPFNLARAGLRENPLLQDPQDFSLINLLRGGIEYADFVTTVSPTYEKETKTQEGGCGLDPILRKHQKKYRGILNGIDTTYWNPLTDSYLAYPYKTLGDKKKNRLELQRCFNLELSQGPIVCVVSRLVAQKGPKLMEAALRYTVNHGGQFILLGSCAEGDVKEHFERLQDEFSSNRNVAFYFGYHEELSHKVFAGSDLTVIPSLFEPCGLTQMIALRYGTLPVVRLTGGLADTVSKENGFVFKDPDSESLCEALSEAFHLFFQNPSKWKAFAEKGMRQDFSWKKSMRSYLRVYEKLLLQ